MELIGCLRAGPNCGAALKAEKAHHLYRAILGLGRAHGVAGERGARCRFCVSRVRLPMASSRLSVRPINLDDLDVLFAQMRCESGAVGPSSLDAYAADVPQTAQPGRERCVAVCGCDEVSLPSKRPLASTAAAVWVFLCVSTPAVMRDVRVVDSIARYLRGWLGRRSDPIAPRTGQ